jgi:hypothetical protein
VWIIYLRHILQKTKHGENIVARGGGSDSIFQNATLKWIRVASFDKFGQDSYRVGQKQNKTKHSEGIHASYYRWLYLHRLHITLQDLRLERQMNRFQRQMFFSKKYGGLSTLSRKLRESMSGTHTLSRICEKSSQVLAHSFSQSHAFSQFARKRAIARKRCLTNVLKLDK